MNNLPMKEYGNQTRAERFRMLDAPTLSPLPLAMYEYSEYKTMVQFWHKGQCVAQHPRSSHGYKHTTNPLHKLAQHRGLRTWTPERRIEMGCSIGPFTGRVVDAILKAKAHPELVYRAVLGLTALQKKYGKERLEKASCVDWLYNAPDRHFNDNLLRSNR